MEAKHNEMKEELIKRLRYAGNKITNFLETDKNIYRIETDVQTNKNIFTNPAIECLQARELVDFDIYQDKKDSISLLEAKDKLVSLSQISDKLENANKPETNIFQNKERIKYFYIKTDRVIFIYRYTQKALLKSKTFLKIKAGNKEFGKDTKELELVTEEDDRITLDKQYPDIIYLMDTNQAFLLNAKQAEFIIELDVAINKTKDGFSKIQKENKIFSETEFKKFEEQILKMNKTKSRKFVKMIENETYIKFVDNRDKALAIKKRYQLDIEFTNNNEIDFNDETSVDAVLHLLADDYVQSFLDEEAKVIDQ